ncbi:MAG: DUF2703 domain-containing protein [candidate division WOR-3 bacterium]
MKILNIKWQRLVSNGQTCPRCDSTEKEVEKAVFTLKRALNPLGINVVLEKREISLVEFKKDPMQSNQIWINDKLLEDWVNGTTSQSLCCDVCGPFECRTVKIEGDVHEAIPADLIIKAGLVAASQLVIGGTNELCCESEATNTPDSSCCPK